MQQRQLGFPSVGTFFCGLLLFLTAAIGAKFDRRKVRRNLTRPAQVGLLLHLQCEHMFVAVATVVSTVHDDRLPEGPENPECRRCELSLWCNPTPQVIPRRPSQS
ncbi:hypothetical protein MAPG_01571 [Magnaporthiopsis poae ATCC 64411]|uniref:Uncharacterized protein n=1 Tax=Magnaporthiopsis poae (strain ATCC 64411 / 73-15) TaxID=644358 RepID=A0A0C4DP21_MAGP6|nr:hypothetical protein MAPG_01571 [Magnaporthiopsis poae ATCC 64411]